MADFVLDFAGADDRRFTIPGGGLIGNVPWTMVTRVQFDDVSGFRCCLSIQNSSGVMVLGLFKASNGDLRCYLPAGGDESKTPSTAFTTGHWYVLAISRVGTLSTDRLRFAAYDETTSTWLIRANGTITVNDPGAHAGGTVRIGQGDNNYYVDGQIAAAEILTGFALTTSAHEDALVANLRTSDWLNHVTGQPSFLSDTNIPVRTVALKDYGSLGLVESTITNTTVVADASTWVHLSPVDNTTKVVRPGMFDTEVISGGWFV